MEKHESNILLKAIESSLTSMGCYTYVLSLLLSIVVRLSSSPLWSTLHQLLAELYSFALGSTLSTLVVVFELVLKLGLIHL
jgi:hypothetical protein